MIAARCRIALVALSFTGVTCFQPFADRTQHADVWSSFYPGKEHAMRNFMGRTSLMLVFGATLLLGGCATQEAVEKAQSTADSAKAAADSAMSAAEHAQSTADAAGQKADQAAADAQTANAKIDQFVKEERHEGRHERRHHRRARHAPMTEPAPAPAQQ